MSWSLSSLYVRLAVSYSLMDTLHDQLKKHISASTMKSSSGLVFRRQMEWA